MDCTAAAGCFGGHHGQCWPAGLVDGPTTTTNNGIDILEAHFGSEPVEAMEAFSNDVLWEEFGS